MTESDLQSKTSDKALEKRTKKQAFEEFINSEYFLGCGDSHALAIYNNGTMAPNCYRCRTVCHG